MGKDRVSFNSVVEGRFGITRLDGDGNFCQVELSTEDLAADQLDELLANRSQFIDLFRVIAC